MTAFAKTASWLYERDEARPDFFANSTLSSIRDNLKSLTGDAPGHRDDPSRDGLEQGSDVICLNGSRRSAFPREAS
jgi:hypothetical protein